MTPRFALSLFALASAATAAPPSTPKHDVVDSYHGTQIHDPYRWLEDADAPAVKQWIDAQNTYADGVMAGFKDAKSIAERVGALALTSTQRSAPEIVANTLFYLRQTPPQPQPVLVAEHWPQGEANVLVDMNKDAGAAITNYWPAPDGKRVAYGTAEGGGEETTIHFIDVADGKVASDALPYAGGGTTPQALIWDADGKGVTYVRLPLPSTVAADKTQFNAALYHHTFGTPASADTLAFGKDLSPVAEYTLMTSPHAKYSAAFVHYGDGNADALYLRQDSEWKPALGTQANIRAAASVNNAAVWDGERLLVIAYEYAPRGKLLAVDADGHSHVLVAQGDWVMNGVAPIKDGFLLTEVNGPDWRVQQYGNDGHFVRSVPLPQTGIGVGAIASTVESPVALISYSGWSTPTHWAQYDASNAALKTVFEVTPPADYSKLKTWRLDATSADGAKVPVTVLALADTKADGKRPLILSAYGGYGITTAPRFVGPSLAWFERGGVYAVANIRGGGEFGEGWHEDGMLGKKQHCFDDFHAAAQALIKAKWTDTAHLGILGGSNGGLLMGAVLTQHPDEFRAVVSFVGVYDMLRSELWPNGAYNVSEYGTVANKADFDWLRAYSPLHNVKPDTAYPAVLLITGVNDPRVAPWQSRKFAAALQEANKSVHPIVLLTRMNEGHGVTASFSQRVGNTGAALGFFAEQLGLGPAPKTEPDKTHAAALH